jgi:hypothetical protein
MANMHVTQRVQAERIELDYPAGTRLLGIRSVLGPATYLAVAVILLLVLSWASAATIRIL